MKVSVLMSSYNHENFVAQAIKSGVNQSFADWEFLIMDDCSTDKTFEIAKSFENDKIRVFRPSYNRGMVQNTNELIGLARGEYIAIINSDDFWEVEKLEKQVRFLDDNSSCGACFTGVNMVGEDGKIISKKKSPFKNFDKDRYQWLNYFFYHSNCLCYPSSMVRKGVYKELGMFSPSFICLLDLDMWIRICIAGYELKVIKENLTNFRCLNNDRNLSGKNKSSLVRDILESQKVLSNYLSIQDYVEFRRIFPHYQNDHSNKSYATWFYMFDMIVQLFSFSKKYYKILDKLRKKKSQDTNVSAIKNFGLHLFYDKIKEDSNNIKILEKDFGFNFKKHLLISGNYPLGIYVNKSKKVRKLKYIVIFLSISVLILTFKVIKNAIN